MVIGLLTLLIANKDKGEIVLIRTIPEHTTVSGIDVGGMSRKEAIRAMKEVFPADCEKKDMVLQLPNSKHTFSPKDTNAHWDYNEAAEKAFSGGNVTLNFLFNKDYIKQKLAELGEALGGTYAASGFWLEGEAPNLDDASAAPQTLAFTKGHSGVGLDTEDVFLQIQAAYRNNEFLVSVADVGTTQEPKKLDLDAIYDQIYTAPQNPAIDKETLSLIPGRFGYGFDLEEAKALLASSENTVRIPLHYISPEISDKDAWFQDILGGYVTPHIDNPDRTDNLILACAKIDDVVIQPGETISYNELLGNRTTANGYKPAPAYVGTELQLSVGGGICQVSSTLYLASLFAELTPVERKNHGFPVDYIPMGLDATVSWGITDLKLRNDYDFPVKIKAFVDDGNVYVKLLGVEQRNYYVKMEYRVEGPDFANAYRCRYERETDELIYRQKDHVSKYLDVVWTNPGFAENMVF